MGFIEEVASLVAKYAPEFGIKVYSPIIAQAILESASGTSNKVVKKDSNGNITEWRHNYFGLKWRDKRCAISNEFFVEGTMEQSQNGSYTANQSKFFKFNSLEDCVIGYFQFTNISSYSNLKGVTDPRTYLENIKEDKYATSLQYVDKNMAVIHKYNLTKYDPINNLEGERKMVINIHAGHNPDGKAACGAVGLIKESTEARRVKDFVVSKLKAQGHTVYDCTCNDGKTVSDVLNKIVAKCNTHAVDLDVSIHFNSNAQATIADGKTTGTEVLLFDDKAHSPVAEATRIATEISNLGFKNRGLKYRPTLTVLKKTNAPALLVECCFVDDADDIALYNAELMANAIVKGITGQAMEAPKQPSVEDSINTNATMYRVQVGAYKVKANAEAMQKKLKSAGFNGIIVEA